MSAALAVLDGIAACDAACCAAIGRRARGQDHKQAVDLIAQVEPGGAYAAKSLDRLIDFKATAHYGVINLGGTDLRHAGALVARATVPPLTRMGPPQHVTDRQTDRYRPPHCG